MRCVEVTMALLNNATKIDPFFAPATRFLLGLGRIIQRNEPIRIKLKHAVHLRNHAEAHLFENENSFISRAGEDAGGPGGAAPPVENVKGSGKDLERGSGRH